MIKQVLVPQINVNDLDVTIVAWNVSSGDLVRRAQAVAVLETNKTAQDIEAEDDGYFYYRSEVNSSIVVGDLLAVISERPLTDAEFVQSFRPLDVSRSLGPGAQLGADQAGTPEVRDGMPRQVSAKAQKLIQKFGLRLEDFPGDEKVTVEMVNELAAAAKNTSTALGGAVPDGPRLQIAPKVHEANAVPDYLLEVETSKSKRQEVEALVAGYHQLVLSEVTVAVDARHVDRMLAVLSERHQFPFTLGDLVCHCCAKLLAEYPELNGCFHGGKSYRHSAVNVGYALNFGKGLKVPVVRGADRKEIIDVAESLRSYILKYSRDEIANKDCSRGSFTITDLSSSNVLTFRPVVGPMQSAILGIAKDASTRQIRLILAFDHRMADGLVAARFLNQLKDLMGDGQQQSEVAGPRADEGVPGRHDRSPAGVPGKEAKLRKLLTDLKEENISYMEFRRAVKHVEESFAVYPLSEGQKGFWVLQKLAPTMTSYNIPICFKWRAVLNVDCFQQAVDALVAEYPILTNVIVEQAGNLVQHARPDVRVTVKVERLAVRSQQKLVSHLQPLVKEPFVLERGPLLRVHLLSLNEREYVVLLIVHHIVCDGASVVLLTDKLLRNYRQLIEGEQPVLGAKTAAFREFIEWEQQWLADTAAADADWSYWRRQLSGPLPECNLPFDGNRRSGPTTKGESLVASIRDDRCAQVNFLAARHEITPSTVYLGLFKVLLHHLTGDEDVIVGMPIAGRLEERFQTTIGTFINMIAVRSALATERSLVALLKQLQMTLMSGLYHGKLPFLQVVKKLELVRTENYSPLFQVTYVYHQLPRQQADPSEVPEYVVGLVQEGQYALTLEIQETAASPLFHWKYDPDLFDAATIRRMIDLYERLVENASLNAESPLKDYLHISSEDSQQPRIQNRAVGKSVPSSASGEPSREGGDRIVPGAAERHSDIADDRSADYLEAKQKLTAIWKDLLRVDILDTNRGFFEMGGSSVTSVLLVAQIAECFACEFSITSLFKYPTIDDMASYVISGRRRFAKSDAAQRMTHDVRNNGAREAIGPTARDTIVHQHETVKYFDSAKPRVLDQVDSCSERWELPSPTEGPSGQAVANGIRSRIELHLRQSIADILGCPIDAIDHSRGITEIGLTSYGLLELISGIEDALSEKISPSVLAECSKVSDLASYLHANYAQKFESLRLTRKKYSRNAGSQDECEQVLASSATNRPEAEADAPKARGADTCDTARTTEAEFGVFRNFRKGTVSIEEMLALVEQEGAVQ